MNRTEIYLEKRNKVIVPLSKLNHNNLALVATFAKNLENLGYVLSPKLARSLSYISTNELQRVYLDIVPVLKKMRGAHRQFTPMYPNFPAQVMEMSQMELYYNAMRHYWSFWMKDLGVTETTWLPEYEKDERLPLTEPVKLDMLDLGSETDFYSIFGTLLSAKSSLSPTDKEIVEWFVQDQGDNIIKFLPETITMKEQIGLLVGLMVKYTKHANLTAQYIKTPTDVLRVAVSISGGDVSLAENTKFVNFNRPLRRFFLGLLEQMEDPAPEMVKYKGQWIRLGERLHPREYTNKFPQTAEAFEKLRNDEPIATFNSFVEELLSRKDVEAASDWLANRPGEFARRLDHVFRLSDDNSTTRRECEKMFLEVADKVSTNVLLQVYTHFKNRDNNAWRAVFPKGNLAKVHVLKGEEDKRAAIDTKFCRNFAFQVRQVLVKRFSKLEKMGNVYVDVNLMDYPVPFSQRSASKALKTLVRGSQIPLDGDYDTIRFFCWWKNMSADGGDRGGWSSSGRVDIDLSAVILDSNWNHQTDIAYYNLKEFGGCHSGDITDAPNGASEFIDVSLSQVLARGGRYIAMNVYNFTQHPFVNLPECFAGWMGRKEVQSGEIYEPKTVKNKIDLTADTTCGVPLIIDAKERKVIWCDLSLKSRATWGNNARSNSNSIATVCRAMAEIKKPNLYDLLVTHAEGRGRLVTDKKKADVVFDAETTPFDIDTILTNYL